jgi:hypothetical protein
MSSPLEERTSFTVAALVDGVVSGVHTIVVLRATIHPAVATSVVFKRDLDPGYIYYGIFMTGGRAGSHAGYNSPVVGLARAPRGGSIEVQSFNLLNPKLSTIIVTDRVSSRLSPSAMSLTPSQAALARPGLHRHWRHGVLHRPPIQGRVRVCVPPAPPRVRRAVTGDRLQHPAQPRRAHPSPAGPLRLRLHLSAAAPTPNAC